MGMKRSAECGVWSAESEVGNSAVCGVWSAECGVWSQRSRGGFADEANSFHRVAIEHRELSREVRRFNTITKINNQHLIDRYALRGSKHSIARRTCGHHLDVDVS